MIKENIYLLSTNLFLEQSRELREIMDRIPYDFKDKEVMELGPLVGVHSYTLQNMGVKRVIAIEGRQQNYEECLYNKITYNMDKCIFVLANIKGTVINDVKNIDICVAFRVLHHLNNPYQVIKKISKITDNLCIFYRVASDNCPDGPETMIHGYKGKRCTEGFNRVSGMQKYSIWLYKEELLRLLKDVGFTNTILIEEGEEGSFIPNVKSKYIILLAEKIK
jgi:hypothetical protein